MNRHKILFVIVAVMAVGMTGYEATKQFLLPQISLWESHAITIIFSCIIAFFIGHFTLKKFEKLLALRERARNDLSEAYNTLESKVEERTWELSLSMEKAEVANRAKSAFLSSMSHELRTPLNAIIGFAQVLAFNAKEPISESQQDCVDHIMEGGKHLLALIEQVLDLGKIEAGKVCISIEDVRLDDLCRECLTLISGQAEIRELQIKSDLGTKTIIIRADYVRLKQVLLNLLSNAVQYNRQAGNITLACTELPNDRARITVTDTGKGLTNDHQDRLFEPFDRLGQASSTIPGAGIGLTITKKLVEAMDGHIGFHSELGTGSSFWVEFPISSDPETP